METIPVMAVPSQYTRSFSKPCKWSHIANPGGRRRQPVHLHVLVPFAGFIPANVLCGHLLSQSRISTLS